MLLWLAQHFQDQLGALRVFNFITFRAVFATLTALLIGLLFGPAVIRLLTTLKVGQAVRTDGPQTHLVKSGTPTMGGALILIGIGISTLLWVDWSNRFVWPVLIVTLGFGVIGWVDDYRKVVYKDPNGMRSREKYLWQSLIGLLAAIYLAFSVSGPTNTAVLELFMSWVQSGFSMELPQKADLIVPFFKTVSYPLGVWGFIALTYFVIVGTSNAVNLTDGLDGLATGAAVMIFVAFILIGVWEFGQSCAVTPGPKCYQVRDPLDIAVLSAAFAGACGGFLWWNTSPAKIFMGDVGALALGGAIAAIAIVLRTQLLLAFLGFLFVLITLSVILQVAYFKISKGKRIFKMAPLQHHFELVGWGEVTIVVRFWIIAALGVAAGLGLFYAQWVVS